MFQISKDVCFFELMFGEKLHEKRHFIPYLDFNFYWDGENCLRHPMQKLGV